VAGLKLRLSLYTIPGQTIYRVTQALILRDADGIVFVADSHPVRMAANEASLRSLRGALRARGTRLDGIPHVFQYNKRDLPNRLALGRLEERLNPASVPFIPSVATEGKGVGATLKELTRRMVKQALALEMEGRAPEHG
jgi:signal recognition particle receptor subunit beta